MTSKTNLQQTTKANWNFLVLQVNNKNLYIYIYTLKSLSHQYQTTFKITYIHSLNDGIHSSNSFCQYLQFTIRHIIQSWTRVAGQYHLNSRIIAEFNEHLTKYSLFVIILSISYLCSSRQKLSYKRHHPQNDVYSTIIYEKQGTLMRRTLQEKTRMDDIQPLIIKKIKHRNIPASMQNTTNDHPEDVISLWFIKTCLALVQKVLNIRCLWQV